MLETNVKNIWKSTSSGCLTLKDAFLHNSTSGQGVKWTKQVWNQDIPPSKSMTNRGRSMASICSICHACAETSIHLFLHCPFASKMWNWFSSIRVFLAL